jgi:DNA-binding PadR family transcriptional regulator
MLTAGDALPEARAAASGVVCLSFVSERSGVLPITAELIRGHTEAIILSHLLSRDSYGYEINKSIQERSAGRYELKEATLYGAFRRLEESGCIQSYWGDEQTGARRRYYRITPQGRQTFMQSREEWRETRKLIDLLLSAGETDTPDTRAPDQQHGASPAQGGYSNE